MKKALSLILAIMMVFALSTTAFAATEDIVGTYNGNPVPKKETYEDGVTDFSSADSSAVVAIKATSTNVESRYAVDITYSEMNMDIAGTAMVWDVNTLKYVPKTAGSGIADQTFPVTVTNRSDKPVKVTAQITEKPGLVPEELTLAVTGDGAYDAGTQTYTKTIDGNLAGATEAQKDEFKLTASSTNWQAVADFYFNEFETTGEFSKTIATLKVTISKP